MTMIFSIRLHNSNKVISCLLIIAAAVFVAKCSSITLNKGGVKNAIIVSEYLLEYQMSYDFTEVQDYMAMRYDIIIELHNVMHFVCARVCSSKL